MKQATRAALWKSWNDLFDKAEEIQTTLENTIDETTGHIDAHKITEAQAGLVALMDIANGWKELISQAEKEDTATAPATKKAEDILRRVLPFAERLSAAPSLIHPDKSYEYDHAMDEAEELLGIPHPSELLTKWP
jgi:hypothetical protein